jgi:hypothetical protein
MKRHKMVNLCPTTYEIAKGLPNFSKFVRTKLLELDERNTFVVKYKMWCPNHDDFEQFFDAVPVYEPYCKICETEMTGKWVNV